MGKRPDQFAAGNAATRADAYAQLVLDRQIDPVEGAQKIAGEFKAFVRAAGADSPVDQKACAEMLAALGLGLDVTLAKLAKRGPVLVRYFDGEALVSLLMPDGPPPGRGGR